VKKKVNRGFGYDDEDADEEGEEKENLL